MTKTNGQISITCANCSHVDSGRYCSNCGAELTDRVHGTLVNFLDSFLKIREMCDYVAVLARIILSPTKNIISLYEEGNSKRAFQFLAYSLTIYMLTSLSKIWIIKAHDLIVSLIFTTQFLVTISISIPIMYKLSSRKSQKSRSFHDFLIISSFFIGLNILAIGIITYIQLLDVVIGTVLMLIILVPIFIYTIRVLKYFWELSTGSILLHLAMGSLVGGVIGIIYLFLCSTIFDVQVQGYGRKTPIQLYGGGIEYRKQDKRGNIDDILIRMSSEFNTKLPMMVDSETRLDTTIATKQNLTYKYTFINYAAEELDPSEVEKGMRPLLVNGLCTNKDMEVFLNAQIPITYAYYGKDGKQITTITIQSSHCIER